MATDEKPTADAKKVDEQSRWIKRIERERKAHKGWRDQAKEAETAYRAEKDGDSLPALFPIWWSTVEITRAAIFAAPPKPDVRKRYSDLGKSDDNLAQAMQRGLEFTLDTTLFNDHGSLVVTDYLVAACGISRAELDTETAEAPIIDPYSQQPITGDDGAPLMQKIITRQSVRQRHFHWSKFGFEPNKDWEAVNWEYFVHDMTADEIEDQFDVDITTQATGDASPAAGDQKYSKTVEVFEIWDKRKKERLFLCREYEELLDKEPDPLRLAAFFPNPKPMFANRKSDELIPKPDYCFIKSQCESINRYTARIRALTKQIKDVGFYDQQLGELAALEKATDGARIPVKNLQERLNGATNASFENVMAVQDNTGRVGVLRELISQRDIEKNGLFETVGISDIVRGASQASETAEAQKIKSQWGNVRIGPKVQAVAYYFRDMFRLLAEIMAEHFELDQLNRMAGMQLTEEEFKTLKSDLSREYAIDVETDSTLASDDAEERTQRLEMVKAMTDYLNVYLPLAQQNLIPAEMVKQTMLFVVRSFKYGRQLEDSLQQMPDNVKQLQTLQQQLHQCQQQLEQAQQQAAQAGQEAQKANASLSATDQQEQARKDAEAQAGNTLKYAQADKAKVEAVRTANEPYAAPTPVRDFIR